MKVVKNKLHFEEQDLDILNSFLKMNQLADELRDLKVKIDITKDYAWSNIRKYLVDNNIPYQSLEFVDKGNHVLIDNTVKKDGGLIDMIKRLGDI